MAAPTILQRPPCFGSAPSCSGRHHTDITVLLPRRHRAEAQQQIGRWSSRGLLRAISLLSTAEFGADREPGVSHSREGLRNSNGAAKGAKDSPKAMAQSARRPFDRGDSHARTHKDEGLPVSLFAPYKNLPEEGRTLTEDEETCDPMERSCQVPMYVWESKCRACFGTGSVQSNSRRGGRRVSGICPSCTGMGYVRRASARLVPNLNGKHMTIGRPPALDDDDFEEYGTISRNGKP